MSESLPDLVWIWSTEHNAYWRPDGCGYTVRASSAGLYPRAKAEDIVTGVNADPSKTLEIEELPSGIAEIQDDLISAAERVLDSAFAANYRLISPFRELQIAVDKGKSR